MTQEEVYRATEWLRSRLIDAEGHHCTIEFLTLIGYDSINNFIEDFNNSLLSKHKVGDFVGVYGYETDVRIQDVRREGSNYAYKVYLADEEEWIYDDDIAYNCND